ncbi:MAG: DUF493 domain-containing protein [Desulfocapsaceae bacterium]|jgi:putative lipoic acid-binding regulatory protein|nr:DUF493 domain-containing protein [Desulfocapsaceae bacterium]
MNKENSHQPLCQRKPDISYPCRWEYKVIGENQQVLTEVITEACSPAIPDIALSNISSSGRYYSLNATLTVNDEQMRLVIFERIQMHPAVKMVI